jgi:ABC-type sugar transport system ATPase subunit
VLQATGIHKTYGGITALRGVDLRVRAGSVHALLGENGAGKSTLVKILGGATRPDEGTVLLDGTEVSFATTVEGVAEGVAVVSQELNLFPDLDVLANLFPMREPKRGPLVDRATMARLARPVLDDLGLRAPLTTLVGDLSLAERQLVEIARALVAEPRVLILDEPTSALEARGTERLLEVLDVVRQRQVAVIFVSHVLEEVMSLCDEVTVLRDGAVVLSAVPRDELTIPQIVEAMLGERAVRERQAVAAASSPRPGGGEVRLDGARVAGRLEDVSLRATAGEVVGLAGLSGSGHRSVLEAVFGLRRLDAGTVLFPDGRGLDGGRRAAIRRGVALVTGDRRRLGLMLDKPIWENVAQVRAVAMGRAGRLLRRQELRARTRRHVERLRIRTSSVDATTGQLSGGNQQKVVFAKWLEIEPSVLLLDDPTRGVDVGTKAEMHALIREEAAAGAPVLLCSTDVDELVAVCDRVLVFFRGRVCAELSGDALQAHAVLEAMNTGSLPAG